MIASFFAWIPKEYRQILIYGVVGVVNTMLHSGVVIFLIEVGVVGAVLANIFGFLCANTFSFFINCKLTFKSPPTFAIYRKFAMVSLVSLVLTVCLSAFAVWMVWHYLIGLILVIVFGPLLTFVLHKNYAFKKIHISS